MINSSEIGQTYFRGYCLILTTVESDATNMAIPSPASLRASARAPTRRDGACTDGINLVVEG